MLTLSGGDVVVLLIVLGAVVDKTVDDEDGVRSVGELFILGSVVSETGGAEVLPISASIELVLLVIVETALLSVGTGVLLLVWLLVIVLDTIDTKVVLTSNSADVILPPVVLGSVFEETVETEVVFCSASVVLLAAVLAETADADVLLAVVMLIVELSTEESKSVDVKVVTSGNVDVELLGAVVKETDITVLLSVLGGVLLIV